MFPHLKAQWDLSDSQLGALVSIVSITVALGAVPLSLLADRWSRVKSHFPDGACLEPRDDRGRIRRELCAIDRCAECRRAGRSRLWNGRRRASGKPVPAADAQHGARRIPRRRNVRVRAGRDARRFHCRALGLAGRVRCGRHPRPFSRIRVPGDRPRLQDRRAARRRRSRIEAPHDAHVPWSPSCCGRAPRSSPASGPA